MPLTRRDALALCATTAAGFGLAPVVPAPVRAAAKGAHTYETESGTLTVHPVRHASLALESRLATIYADPAGGADLYADLPAPDLVLITHEHEGHFDPETLRALVDRNPDVVIRTNPAVHDIMPEDIKANADQISTSDTTEIMGVRILAVPAYNTTGERLEYHPPGRDNGYVLTIDGLRVYIAGGTEDTAEMRELDNIDIAFVPMSLPLTMSVRQAADAVEAFEPRVVYPYMHRGSDLDEFERLLDRQSEGIRVVRAEWYPS